MGAGIVRVARPTERGVPIECTAPVRSVESLDAMPLDSAVPSDSVAQLDGAIPPTGAVVASATVTRVRTESQATRRAVSAWIGLTPRRSAGAADGCRCRVWRGHA